MWRKMKNFISLKKNSEFKFVYENGKSYANKYLVLYVVKNDLKENHIGISVSKKVGNSVVRHRLTRLIRESYRLNKEKFNSGLDLIIVARVNAKGKSYKEVESALLHLGKMQGILKKEDEDKKENS
jgi:ribonuclease P protein component